MIRVENSWCLSVNVTKGCHQMGTRGWHSSSFTLFWRTKHFTIVSIVEIISGAYPTAALVQKLGPRASAARCRDLYIHEWYFRQNVVASNTAHFIGKYKQWNLIKSIKFCLIIFIPRDKPNASFAETIRMFQSRRTIIWPSVTRATARETRYILASPNMLHPTNPICRETQCRRLHSKLGMLCLKMTIIYTEWRSVSE